MRTFLLLGFMLCFTTTLLVAQSGGFWKSFNLTEEITCPNDPNTQRMWPVDTEVYQTLNNEWNGEKDTEVCPDFDGPRVLLLSIKPQKLFLRLNIDPGQNQLLPNEVLYGFAGINYTTVQQFTPQHRVHVILDHETILMDGTDSTVYSFDYDQWGTIIECFGVENFEEVAYRSIIIEVDLPGQFQPSDEIRVNFVSFEPIAQELKFLESLSFEPEHKQGNKYRATLEDLAYDFNIWTNSYVAYHPDIQDSRAGLIHYFDVGAPDELQPLLLELLLEYSNFIVHPYVHVRGGEIYPGSSERHELQIIQEFDYCLPAFIDLTMDGTSWKYQSGNIHHSNFASCMQFMNGGKLIVQEGATLSYGAEGVGMLALRDESSIVLEDYAKIEIGNTLVLLESFPGAPTPEIVLKRGNSMRFLEGAEIIDPWSSDGGRYITVYMNGGTIDLDELSAESRSRVRLVYPEEQDGIRNKAAVYGNLGTSETVLSTCFGKESIGNYRLFDMSGNILFSQSFVQAEGWQDHLINKELLTPGLYILSVSDGVEQIVFKLVK